MSEQLIKYGLPFELIKRLKDENIKTKKINKRVFFYFDNQPFTYGVIPTEPKLVQWFIEDAQEALDMVDSKTQYPDKFKARIANMKLTINGE